MGRFLGIDFAPLNVPLERRMQTLVVSHFAFTNFILGPFSIALYIYLFFTDYYYISLLYTCWLYYDRDSCEHGSRNFVLPSPAFVKCFPGIDVMAVCLKILFMIPLARDYLSVAGMCASTPRSIHYLLNRNGGNGNAVAIAPGGAAEVYEAHPNTAVIVLKKRRGFIRLAVMNGAHLVPVYAFGETDLYYQVPNPEGSLLRRFQETFKKYTGYPLFNIFVNGRGFFQYTFGILPYRRPIYTVVGEPIPVEKCENPSPELLDKYHAIYVDCLKKLFDEHKVKLGGHFKTQELIVK